MAYKRQTINLILVFFLLTQTITPALAQQSIVHSQPTTVKNRRVLVGKQLPTANDLLLPTTYQPLTTTHPLPIIENVGQFAEPVRYQMQSDLGTLHFTDNVIWLTILAPLTSTDTICSFSIDCQDDESVREGVHLRLSFVGANPTPTITPINPFTTTISYFTGNDPDHWHSAVPVYGGLVYKDLYPGIDIEFSSSGNQWVPRLIADPAADLSQVAWHVEGADSHTVTPDNQHLLQTAVGAFTLPAFTSSQPATANPQQLMTGEQLVYSTFLGGSNQDFSSSIDIDSVGGTYLAGTTFSADFTTTVGSFQNSLVETNTFAKMIERYKKRLSGSF